MNVETIAAAFEAAGFKVNRKFSDNIDIEDHSVEILDTDFHITIHPDELYFTAVEEDDGGNFIFYEDWSLDEIIQHVKEQSQ